MPTVKDIYKQSILSIDAGGTVLEAARLMKNHGRGSLIVYEGANAHGIITETDLIRRVLAKNLPYTTKVEEAMSKPLIMIESDVDVKDAANLMLLKKIRRLPIDDNGKLIGIITSDDLLHSFTKRTLSEKFLEYMTRRSD